MDYNIEKIIKEDKKKYDYTSHKEFIDYYKRESLRKETYERFIRIREMILRTAKKVGKDTRILTVGDIGCGAGTFSRIWAELGHRVYGIDINSDLIGVAEQRTKDLPLNISFCIGSATDLPWQRKSIDICVMIELLEHVKDWKKCIDEIDRVLKKNGILFLSTSNKLCPIQQEYNLPFYSWYPSKLKKHYETLAATNRPELANYAKYPAINWFSFYMLKNTLNSRGFKSHDRFELKNLEESDILKRLIIKMVNKYGVLKYFAYILTPGTIVVAIKKSNQ